MNENKIYAGVITSLATIRVLIERVKANRTARKAFRVAGVCLLAALVIVAYTVVIFRVASTKAVEKYEIYLAEVRAQEEAAALEAYQTDPYTMQLNVEAEQLAKVLYGVKDNKTDDLITYCWCVFNRVDNKAFPATLADVLAQPNQWMRYDQTNPIIESLYQIAREQLDAWHTGSHRPVSNEYVFMNWSSNDICLRDNFHEGSGTHYWRYGQ